MKLLKQLSAHLVGILCFGSFGVVVDLQNCSNKCIMHDPRTVLPHTFLLHSCQLILVDFANLVVHIVHLQNQNLMSVHLSAKSVALYICGDIILKALLTSIWLRHLYIRIVGEALDVVAILKSDTYRCRSQMTQYSITYTGSWQTS